MVVQELVISAGEPHSKMFAKLKKKIAEETAITQRPGGGTRIARSVSKESVASMGADSGDDFVSIFSCF